ncbi:hypothetical protein ACFV0D_31180, partial [Streptomyces sp. NPDC059556]
MTLTTPAKAPPREGRWRTLGLRADVRNLSLLGVLAVLVVVGGRHPAPAVQPNPHPPQRGTQGARV